MLQTGSRRGVRPLDRGARVEPDPIEAQRRLGMAMRSARRARGLTLRELAARVGCVKGYLSSIENGRKPPPGPGLAERLERELGLEAGLIGRVGAWCRTPARLRGEVSPWEASPGEGVIATLRSMAGLEDAARVEGVVDLGGAPTILPGDWVVLGPAGGVRGARCGSFAAFGEEGRGVCVRRYGGVGCPEDGARGAMPVLALIRVFGSGAGNGGTAGGAGA